MRELLREYLLNEIPALQEIYEPAVASKDSTTPYGVIVQCDDTDSGDITGFTREFQIWLFEDRTTFNNLDTLTEQVRNALDKCVIQAENDGESFTCIFNGLLHKDGVDDEFNTIYRCLSFNIVALHDVEQNSDVWLSSLKTWTQGKLNVPVYLNNWLTDLAFPSILFRIKGQNLERINSVLIKEKKTVICHIAGSSEPQINNIIDFIQDALICDVKLPFLNGEDNRYMTYDFELTVENRNANMLTKGQLELHFYRYRQITENIPMMSVISGTGKLK